MNYSDFDVNSYREFIKKYPYAALKKRILDSGKITIPQNTVLPKYGSNVAAVKDVVAYGLKIGLLTVVGPCEYKVMRTNTETTKKFIKYRPPVGLSGRKWHGGSVRITRK